MVQVVKNPPAIWQTWLQSLGLENPVEKGIATHCNILVFWPGEFHRLCNPSGHRESDMTEPLSL